MRVNVEGDKYTICQSDKGKVWVERYGKPWVEDPQGQNMLIAAAFELACLRKIAKAAIALAEHGDKGGDVSGHVGGLADVIRGLNGYTDFRRNLDDKLDL